MAKNTGLVDVPKGHKGGSDLAFWEVVLHDDDTKTYQEELFKEPNRKVKAKKVKK